MCVCFLCMVVFLLTIICPVPGKLYARYQENKKYFIQNVRGQTEIRFFRSIGNTLPSMEFEIIHCVVKWAIN